MGRNGVLMGTILTIIAAFYPAFYQYRKSNGPERDLLRETAASQ